ncbi:hypothetical protein IWQ47_004522 [Aquimarina sp. EL_43]|uniref:hypothetical protein n=1 Tax=unclassified Aquimarina TaxID=2627091 RepID=UPI0018CACA87|nr:MULTISPECIES: hypothetical protein [unclassified Aquimarina]MBG6133144.1 hypothetical protein [Aquimarina sp. EL_35]MBG6153302.1 hypothetical protein [Aquimarina sp. EL_32]MBG6171429.1 hypothetical protein [Aquimarina sp. EL_43]
MKRIKFIQVLCIICVVLFTTSCEDEVEGIQPILEQTSSGEFAVFTFANGNKLQLIESDEEGDPVIIAIESGFEQNKMFIDFDRHSMLDVYLALTSEKTPIPKVLIDMSKSFQNQKLLEKRQIVPTMNIPVTIGMTKIPESLLQKFPVNRGFCDKEYADYCEGDGWDLEDVWKSGNKKKKIEGYTHLFSDSGTGVPHMTVKFKYKKANGSWKENDKATHKIYKGHGKRITYIGGKKRYRGSWRSVPGGFLGHWKGWTDVRN